MRNRASPLWLVALALYASGAAAEPDTFGVGTGRDGELAVLKPGTVINRYAQVTGPLAPGDLQVFVTSSEGFAGGDLVLVLQTTGIVPEPPRGAPAPVELGADPVGRWELARLVSVSPGELGLKAPLVHSYAGRVTQVIRVPEFTDVAVRPGASLVARPWNGETGGVLAFLATGTVDNEGELQASGAGFRGGTAEQLPAELQECGLLPREVRPGARRGEGVSVMSYGPGETGMDNASNGGGGGICPLSGGGGGGNGGAGGRGGDSSTPWDVTREIGGRGGVALRYSMLDHLTLGGGGGKGHGEDASGSPAGAGGGAIFVRADRMTGSGQVLARGEAGGSASGSGASGGGAGGSLYLRLAGPAECGSLSARGGGGGSPREGLPMQAGAGGGGGGGRVLFQAAATNSCPIDVEAGVAGAWTATGAARGVIQRLTDGYSASSVAELATLDTVIASTPQGPTYETTATFKFTGAGPQGKYWCREYAGTAGAYQDCGTAGSGGTGDTGAKTFSNLAPGIHTFEVYAQDKDGNVDATPANFLWTIQDTAITSTPSSPTYQTTATFKFTGAGTGGKYWCRESAGAAGAYQDCGTAGSGGTGDTGAKTFSNLAPGIHTFEVYAQDSTGKTDASPATFLWTIQDTAIASAPPNPDRQTTATFKFTGAGVGGKYWCREYAGTAGDYVDCGAAGSGGSGDTGTKTFTGLVPGIHTFEVFAQDAAGNMDSTAANYLWTVDTTPPDTAIANHPPDPTHETTATFTFTGAEAKGRYWCREYTATPGAYQDCGLAGSDAPNYTGTKTFTGLAPGSHTFEVYAVDEAGNEDATAAQFTWVIDLTPPDTVIVGHPQDPTNETTAAFTFTGAGSGGKYWCRAYTGTAGTFQDCGAAGSGGAGDTGAKSFINLAAGSHTFEVYAEDAAGNLDATVARFTWVIDLTPPDTAIASAPKNPDNQTTATFTFTGAGTGGKYWCRAYAGTAGAYEDCGAAGAGGTGDTGTKAFSGLVPGIYTFEVYAEDAAGNQDATPATYLWTVDTSPPDTAIASHPQDPTNQTTATFTFTGAETGGKYWCREYTATPGTYQDCGAAGSGGTGDMGAKSFSGLVPGFHTFEVYAQDAAGNADSTVARSTWVIDLTPPDTTIVGHPQDPTNQTTAVFTFTGAGAGGRYWCRLTGNGAVFEDCGAAGSGGSGDMGAKSFPNLAAGLHTFQVYAQDAAGNVDASPAQFDWNIDDSPPDTVIVTSPKNPTNQTTATFTFTGAGAGGRYWCREWTVTSGPYENCGAAGSGGLGDTGAKTLTSLANGIHTFEVYAEDAAGNVDSTPAKFIWTVNTIHPVTVLASQPQNPTHQTTATFTFTGAGTGGKYWCREWRTTAGTYQDCGAAGSGGSGDMGAKTFNSLPDGDHTFEVYAEDAAGNLDDSPASYIWTVDTQAPDTTITSKPPDPSNQTTARFEFSANEEGVSFTCLFDMDGPVSCASPYVRTNIGETPSPHTFRVYATDAAGNTEGEAGAASYSWVVDLTAPETKIEEAPPSPSNSPDATFRFSSNETGGTYLCTLDNASQASCPNPVTFRALPDGPHNLCVIAKDLAGNEDGSAACHPWIVDTGKPHTEISTGPTDPTHQTTATFSFSAGEPGVTYKCRLDSEPTFTSCTSPKEYTGLGETPKPHVFRVYATDTAGNTEGEAGAATYSWVVDLTPPNPPVVVLPAEGECTNSNTVNVEGSTEASATVTVFLDGLAETARTATADGSGRWSVGVPLGELSDGTHAITAKAKDLADNTGTLSSGRNFIRDRDPPETWFVEKPPVLSRSSRAVFKFGSDESGVRYKCNLYDGKGVFECSNGLELTGLIDGSHTLAVWAVDCAGNEDPTPEVYQWTVDTIAPEVIVTSPKEGEAVGESSPVISGTSEKSAKVEVIVDDTDPQTPPVKGAVEVGTTDGTWSFTVPVSLPNGDYTVTATATDPAGNIGPPFGPVPFKVDTSPPDTEIVRGPPAIDIHDSTDFVFQSSKGGTSFEYSLDKVPEQESDWHQVTNKYTTPSLKNGKHFLLVRAIDDAGNKDPEPAKAEWEVAAERPPPPEFIDPVEGSVVYSLTPTITGTTVPAGTVDIFIDRSEIKAETPPSAIATADEDGNWAYTLSSEMAEGPHTLAGRAANIYKNKGELSSPLTFTVVAPKPQAKAIGGGLGCDASSSSASPWLALLGLLAVTVGRARRQRSE